MRVCDMKCILFCGGCLFLANGQEVIFAPSKKVDGNVIDQTKISSDVKVHNFLYSGSCSVDEDCDDKDSCTINTCKNEACSYSHDCKMCSLSKLVTVDILTDNCRDKTTWEIIDYSSNEQVMMMKNISSYDIGRNVHSASKCLREGAYMFAIHDLNQNRNYRERNGKCRYQITVGGDRKVFENEFERTKKHFFLVRDDVPAASLTLATPENPSLIGLKHSQLLGVKDNRSLSK